MYCKSCGHDHFVHKVNKKICGRCQTAYYAFDKLKKHKAEIHFIMDGYRGESMQRIVTFDDEEELFEEIVYFEEIGNPIESIRKEPMGNLYSAYCKNYSDDAVSKIMIKLLDDDLELSTE